MELSDLEKTVLAQCTLHEKECIYQAVRATMMSDGDSVEPELTLLNEVAGLLGLSNDECLSSKTIEKGQLVATIRDMNYFKRLITGKLMTKMVYADDVVTQREQLFIQHIFDQFNIPVAD